MKLTQQQITDTIERAGEISEAIEALQEERAETLSELERNAYQIAKAMRTPHGSAVISRTTETVDFRGLGEPGSRWEGQIHFRITDTYDGWNSGEVSLTPEQLADPDAAIAAIRKKQQREAAVAARAEIKAARRRLASLEGE